MPGRLFCLCRKPGRGGEGGHEGGGKGVAAVQDGHGRAPGLICRGHERRPPFRLWKGGRAVLSWRLRCRAGNRRRSRRPVATRGRGLQVRRLDREELQLHERQGRKVGQDDPLQLLEERDALFRVRLALRPGDQVVDRLVPVAGAVGPGDVLADRARPVGAVHAHLRVGERGEPGDRDVELAVAIDALGVGGGVLGADVGLDADAPEPCSGTRRCACSRRHRGCSRCRG